MTDRIVGGRMPKTTLPSNSVQSNTINVKTTEPIHYGDKKEQTNYFKEKLEKLKNVVDGMNKFIQASNTHLKFELHDKLNEYYVKVIDDKTHEVVKEIPSKRMLDIFAEMEKHLGLLVDKKI